MDDYYYFVIQDDADISGSVEIHECDIIKEWSEEVITYQNVTRYSTETEFSTETRYRDKIYEINRNETYTITLLQQILGN